MTSSLHGTGSLAPAPGIDAPAPFVCLGCWLGTTEFDDLWGEDTSKRKKKKKYSSVIFSSRIL